MTLPPALDRLRFGAPGLYSLPEQPVRALTSARMDVCAFIGVAPRGPARPPLFGTPWAQKPCGGRFPRSLAVPVESFGAYRRLYGGFEGPGRLPYAVLSFFEQGGRRAYIVRVVHNYLKTVSGSLVSDEVENGKRVARGVLGEPALQTLDGGLVTLTARDEGTWGNALTACLSFSSRPLSFAALGSTSIVVRPDEDLPAGSLLRLRLPGDVEVLRYVTFQQTEWHPTLPEQRRSVVLHAPLSTSPEMAEVISGTLEVDDHDGRRERHEQLGLASDHPRFIGRVLCEDSILLYPDQSWLSGAIDFSEPRLEPIVSQSFTQGADDYPALVPDDFFDEFGWTAGDDCPGAGIQALAGIPDLGSVAVVDLYSPGPLRTVQSVVPPPSLAGPSFADCMPIGPAPEQALNPPELKGLLLDPTDSGDRERIIELQLRVVEFAEAEREFVALLDVPPGMTQRQILRWRERFGSSYAAAYHPWLKTVRADGQRDELVSINPSAVGAGIIAKREVDRGIPFGPANALAQGIVDVTDRTTPAEHDVLHQNAINVFMKEREGVRLTAARTLSRNPQIRQLSVRRLLTMLRRTIQVEMQWAAFEPNNASLRLDVQRLLTGYLRRLWQANAFSGATEQEAFFVKCDDELNSPAVVDQGRLMAHVGVAPAEPLEFLVLRISRGADGSLAVVD